MQAIDPCLTVDQAAAVTPPSPFAAWIFVGALVVILVFELWAGHTGHETISQWMRRLFGRHRWWRPFALGVLGLTLWHLFFGGPI